MDPDIPTMRLDTGEIVWLHLPPGAVAKGSIGIQRHPLAKDWYVTRWSGQRLAGPFPTKDAAMVAARIYQAAQ